MKREYYSSSIEKFYRTSTDEIIGILTRQSEFAVEQTQRIAWESQVKILKEILVPYKDGGYVYFEYSIPRMGKRIDVVLVIKSVIFVLEFKVGETEFHRHSIDQVWDYALDLKNFHETSHDLYIAPILIATNAKPNKSNNIISAHEDKLLEPLKSNTETLVDIISNVIDFSQGKYINNDAWSQGRYCPTPTIIESAMALYNGHCVEDITRNDAGAINLGETSNAISEIIENSIKNSKKSICFVTGVPGAGKTLVGLKIATTHINKDDELYSVFLSGNDPLVKVLREALIRDKVVQEKARGNRITKKKAANGVKSFIQNVHHFRDEYLKDICPPREHVTLFDEAQRAWTVEQTSSFMKQKKGWPDFDQSEPEFLISCLNRHEDWAIIVCLVGGGQEINKGEAGISEWINALEKSFPDWQIFLSNKLTDSEYGSGKIINQIKSRTNVHFKDSLHLSVSMRSFRAENVSLLVKCLLDLEAQKATEVLADLKKYPIVITRDLDKAKRWVRKQARGSERYGIVVSSQAERLKPHAIHVKSPVKPEHWFLNAKDDVRSSYYLEDVATEFHIQGLELDWTCVVWDADFRYSEDGWRNWSFKGNKWQRINKKERQLYQKNAYRVLLTRARQGMVIVVPSGDRDDHTRVPDFYDPTFKYLENIGFEVI